MASYANTDDVNVLMGPHRISETTKLNLTDLQKLLANVDADINTRLVAFGVSVVPVVDPAFKLYLKTIETWSAAAQAFKIQFPEAVGPGEQPAYAYWEKRYQEALKMLTSVGSGLIPEDLMGTTGQASSYFTRNPDEEEELGDLAGRPHFTVDNLQEHPW